MIANQKLLAKFAKIDYTDPHPCDHLARMAMQEDELGYII